ncbi:MAG: DUF1993 domain-containing protein [Rhodospirillales bacterium]
MVTMTLTTLLVPTYRQGLQALSLWLEKARKLTPEAKALLSARLAADMYPLSAQVRFACLQAQEAVFRLRGEAIPGALEELALEGRNAGEQPGSLSDAQARLAEALSFLDDLEGDALDAGEERPIAIELPNGMIFDMTGAQYGRDWALPQFYFHLTTAYAILRNRGVALGKADYVGQAFAYLRPGTMPQV